MRYPLTDREADEVFGLPCASAVDLPYVLAGPEGELVRQVAVVLGRCARYELAEGYSWDLPTAWEWRTYSEPRG
ncbi:MAG TPA: hypothetical protein VF062_29185 [Candidatus Limnocylindrales bacterium]